MASRPPDEEPQTIVLGQFSGIRNTIQRERLGLGELEAAVNVDLDDSGQLKRRRGQTRVATGSWHSLRTIRGTIYGVKDGDLGVVDGTYQHTAIHTVGTDPLDYVEIAGTVYFTSRSASGKLVDGAYVPWGQTGGDGEWISPVVNPTDTLGAISGKVLIAPPLADMLTEYNGRIYLASGKVLWVTELYLYDKVDRDKNYIQFEQTITMLHAVDDGIYVGTEGGLYFLSGTFAKGLPRKQIDTAPVVKGSNTTVSAEVVHPQARDREIPIHDAVVFMTHDGICAGFNGGEVYNLTRSRVMFPAAQSAAALYRVQDGVNQYVAVADNAGGATSAAAIGDYVEAELRRHQGG